MNDALPRQPMIEWSWRTDVLVAALLSLILAYDYVGVLHNYVYSLVMWDPFFQVFKVLTLLAIPVSALSARTAPLISSVCFAVLFFMKVVTRELPLVTADNLAAFWFAYAVGRWANMKVARVLVVAALAAVTQAVVIKVSWQAYSGHPTDIMMLWFFGMAALGTPFFVGLFHRSRQQAFLDWQRAEEAERRQRSFATALAKAEQEEARLTRSVEHEMAAAQLARDVHDVVGHSLAVILAQAEAAQFQKQSEALHESMANIAQSARRSLGEIREVLSKARGEATAIRTGGDIEQLVASLRTSGVDIEQRVDGAARALPPELEMVAYRVLQEMLTNAMRYGQGKIVVQQIWADRLTLQVRNLVAQTANVPRELGGAGIPGMRSRLESVGGSFETQRHASTEGELFIATAWLPIRHQGADEQ